MNGNKNVIKITTCTGTIKQNRRKFLFPRDSPEGIEHKTQRAKEKKIEGKFVSFHSFYILIIIVIVFTLLQQPCVKAKINNNNK